MIKMTFLNRFAIDNFLVIDATLFSLMMRWNDQKLSFYRYWIIKGQNKEKIFSTITVQNNTHKSLIIVHLWHKSIACCSFCKWRWSVFQTSLSMQRNLSQELTRRSMKYRHLKNVALKRVHFFTIIATLRIKDDNQ